MDLLKWLNPNIAKLTPYQTGKPIEDVARDFDLEPADISKLASNENPLGCSPQALQRVSKYLPQMSLYPDGNTFYLRQKLADIHQLEMENFIIGNGSNEIIELIGHCFMASNNSTIFSQYAFIVYKLVSNMFGAKGIEVAASKLGHNLSAMLNSIEQNSSVIFICNPNNPTGTLLEQAELDSFMEKVPEDILVVFDEAYNEICLGNMPNTIKYIHAGRNCVILRTFSKAYGLAGFRIGYAMGAKPIISALEKSRQPFNVNRLAQEAALGALDDTDFVLQTKQLFRESKKYIESSCNRLGLEFIPTTANFILIKVGNAGDISKKLLQAGIIVRPMAGYDLPDFIRLSFGTMNENRNFINTLKIIMQEDKNYHAKHL